MAQDIKHFREKSCPGLGPGWTPVFRGKYDKQKSAEEASGDGARADHRGDAFRLG
jgi:hypothetical protein